MNKTMIQYFHCYRKAEGLLWKEISENFEWLACIGIIAAWVPPSPAFVSHECNTQI